MDECYERIAEFLSEYISTGEGNPVPADPIYIRDAISFLIYEEVFTKEELKIEALEKKNVIIPDRLFI